MKELEQLPIPLLLWYREHARVLPWRSNTNPYGVWVSEIMLQQTRVAAVLDYYRRFLQAAPTVGDLATLSQEQLMKLWQGLGYYSRARNLQKAAIQIMEQCGGVFPNTYEALLTLAGVGEYTAGAIASIAFEQPVAAVDGNVLRVCARICGDDGDITTPAMKKKVKLSLEQIIPVNGPGDFNQAMMELGATVCLPNGAPLCEQCPAAHFCQAYLHQRTGELPVKAPKKARRVEQRAVYLLFYQGQVAIRPRPDKGLLAGLWEYPNHLWDGENHLEGWGVAPCALERVGAGKHIFTHIEWHMSAYVGQLDCPQLPQGWVWADRVALRDQYTLPNAFQSFDEQVADRLGRFA